MNLKDPKYSKYALVQEMIQTIDVIKKFQEVLVRGVGLKVVAIADHDTPFTTIRVPSISRGNETLCALKRRMEPVGRNRSGNRYQPR